VHVHRDNEQLPARQRVTARFRARPAERFVDGAAHAEVAREERTTPYQVARAFRRARPAHRRALAERAAGRDPRRDRGGLDRPLRCLPPRDPSGAAHARIVCDHFHLVRGANPALEAVRRERQRRGASGAVEIRGDRLDDGLEL
jgi:hypothetical protein